mgnify:CR=1 FL=1
MPANIIPTAETDGTVYARDVPLTSTEASLGDALVTPALIPVIAGQTIIAVVQLTLNGHVTGNSAYVFLQTDLGDGVWVDVAWCRTTVTDGSAKFVLCGGGLGAMNNAFGPLRQSGSAPATQANGSNAVPLGGRCRFSGFATSVGGSSSISGTTAGTLATITYKLQLPR